MGILDEIKKSAGKNGTKIQSSDAAKMEKILNNLFFLEKDIEEETKFINHIMTRGLESQERVGLHASAMLVGEKDFCLRAQVLSLIYKQSQGEQISPGLKRIFEEGNAIHEKWQRLFIRGAYSYTQHLDATQFDKDYRLSFTPDIICQIPQMYNGIQMIGEIKSVNEFQYKKIIKHPSAWKQCQWYMHLKIKQAKKLGNWNGKDFTKGFVLNDNKNNQDFKIEIYDYDPLLCEPFIDRAESIKYHYKKVFSDKKMVKRPDNAKSPDCKRCSTCFMREACWNIGKGKIRIK